MNDNDTKESRSDPPESGLPLGGVGAGCIEMGTDGCFRNVTINNNRSAKERFDHARGAFLALRAKHDDGSYSRVLQSTPVESAHQFSCINSDQFSWKGLYPISSYRLRDIECPVRMTWNAMSPVIPFDDEASTLPLIIIAMQVENATKSDIEVAGMFNWENLCNCNRQTSSSERGEIRTVIPPKADVLIQENEEEDRLPIGLSFGRFEDFDVNEQGNYCLIARSDEGIELTYKSWNRHDQDQAEEFWDEFSREGFLDNRLSNDDEAHSGAVCCSTTIGPGKTRQFLFVFTWFFPHFELNDVDIGNGYANKFQSATDIAEYALKNHRFYINAVSNWHQSFEKSSLPEWFCEMLINSLHVLSTNTWYSGSNDFAIIETPQDPGIGGLDRTFHYSLPTLLFFPYLANKELAMYTRSDDDENDDSICNSLGRLCQNENARLHGTGESVSVCAKFILLAYRNFCMGGKMARLMDVFPIITEAIAYICRLDRNNDGLPEIEGGETIPDGCKCVGLSSYTASLWVAAIHAYLNITKKLRQNKEATQCKKLAEKAVKSFENKYWNEEAGYYRLSDNTMDKGCHCGQLAGQWYADFLRLGTLFNHDRICSALDRITEINGTLQGVISYVDPEPSVDEQSPEEESANSACISPAFSMTHYSSLLFYHGRADTGIKQVEKCYWDVVNEQKIFNQPMSWDKEQCISAGWGSEKYAGAMAAWHSLFALQGFFLNLPEKIMYIMPNLPTYVCCLDSPLLSPSCLGWLTYYEKNEGQYFQQLQICFDSPIYIQKVVLRLPKHFVKLSVHCSNNGDVLTAKHTMENVAGEYNVTITFNNAIPVGKGLVISMQDDPPVPLNDKK